MTRCDCEDDHERAAAGPDRALALLARFCRTLLPGVLRRIASWKGVPWPLMRCWIEDVEQDLTVDCIAHHREILALAEAARHTRWMQQAERAVYDQLRHGRRRARVEPGPGPTLEAVATAPPDAVAELPDELLGELSSMCYFGNGRMNVEASARATGDTRHLLKRRLHRVADHLGWDDEQRNFWQQRAAEALRGLGADLLRSDGRLHVVAPHTLPRPDLERRRRRLVRLARRVPQLPGTWPTRHALTPWRRNRRRAEPPARAVLERSCALAPDGVAGWLWAFEACCADGDVEAARRTLRRAHRAARGSRRAHRDGTRDALVLARARLCELRGDPDAGVEWLRRRAAGADLPLVEAAIQMLGATR